MSHNVNPRIVILDNDETTGNYRLLFLLYEFLIESVAGAYIDFHDFVYMVHKFNNSRSRLGKSIIRPYVGMFLSRLMELKKEGLIDHIVMLTNQHSSVKWNDVNGSSWTISEIIAALLFIEAEGVQSDELWSTILTRDLTAPQIGGYNVKYLSRVFRALNIPIEYWSYKHVWFIDDYAERPYAELWSPVDLANNALPSTFADVSISDVFEKVVPYRATIMPADFENICMMIINSAKKNAKYGEYTAEHVSSDIKKIKKLLYNNRSILTANGVVIEGDADFQSISLIDGISIAPISAATRATADRTFIELTAKLNDKYDSRSNGKKQRRGGVRKCSGSPKQPKITDYMSKRPRSASKGRNNASQETS